VGFETAGARRVRGDWGDLFHLTPTLTFPLRGGEGKKKGRHAPPLRNKPTYRYARAPIPWPPCIHRAGLLG
jgi:hypothetical protein